MTPSLTTVTGHFTKHTRRLFLANVRANLCQYINQCNHRASDTLNNIRFSLTCSLFTPFLSFMLTVKTILTTYLISHQVATVAVQQFQNRLTGSMNRLWKRLYHFRFKTIQTERLSAINDFVLLRLQTLLA